MTCKCNNKTIKIKIDSESRRYIQTTCKDCDKISIIYISKGAFVQDEKPSDLYADFEDDSE